MTRAVIKNNKNIEIGRTCSIQQVGRPNQSSSDTMPFLPLENFQFSLLPRPVQPAQFPDSKLHSFNATAAVGIQMIISENVGIVYQITSYFKGLTENGDKNIGSL